MTCPAHPGRAVYRDGVCYTDWHAARKLQRRQRRHSQVKRLYGLSPEDLAALRAYQRGRCWICRKATGATKALAVDHDHRLGNTRPAVRGLLCSTCNRFLGHLGDEPEALFRAALYLIDPPARKVLK